MRARRFDHDEAFARWQAGESFVELAAGYGVGYNAVRQAVLRRDPAHRERMNTYSRERLRKPCIRGCGRLAWHHMGRPGVCAECARAERRAQAEAQDNHGTETRYKLGCRCEICRKGASDAKRRRREASRVPCSHGCGTLVDGINRGNPEKPPECNPCAVRRVHAELKGTGRLGRKKAGA